MKQGGPFEVVKTPKPEPASDEVVVRLKVVALNPLDWKQMSFQPKVQRIDAKANEDRQAVGNDDPQVSCRSRPRWGWHH